jgi:hypothetical protein
MNLLSAPVQKSPRVASRNFVTECLIKDVTKPVLFPYLAFGLKRNAWCDDHDKAARDAETSCVWLFISQINLCTASRRHAITRRCNV